MGCFDFTYADNGENIRGGHGYIYLTKAFEERTKLKSPLKFTYTNEYGDFHCILPNAKVDIDIHALHSAMLYLEKVPSLTNIFNLKEDYYEEFLDIIRYNTFDENMLQFQTISDDIRTYSINKWFDCQQYHENSITATIKPLGNQREKTVSCKKSYTGNVPILISKKKLPKTDTNDLIDIAKNWGYVSTGDPNQGCGRTKNLYCIINP